MIRGLYTAAAGMLTQQVTTETLADNIANVSTAGFKRRTTEAQAFPEMVLQRLSNGESVEMGRINTGSSVYSTPIHYNQGSFRETGNTYDLGIEGKGFFQVELPDGRQAYTRSGNFRLNEEGDLTTQQGYKVLGASGGPINIPQSAGLVSINSSGIVTGAQIGELGQLGLAVFENEGQLEKLGDSLFISANDPDDVAIPGSYGGVGTINQGYLEQSNVKILSEMVQLITSQRMTEALQKSIQTQNQTLGKVINEVGKA